VHQPTASPPASCPTQSSAARAPTPYLLTVTLSEALTAEGVKGWLTDVTGLINTLQGTFLGTQRAATVNVAFAASFFQTSAGAPRFELTAAQIPVELAAPPSLPALSGVAPVSGDLLFYIMGISEAAVAAFQSGLSATHGTALELGFQRADGREQFGFRDGLRNIPRPRSAPKWCSSTLTAARRSPHGQRAAAISPP
jgi:deferrochelatase/peroxidase EfeB